MLKLLEFESFLTLTITMSNNYEFLAMSNNAGVWGSSAPKFLHIFLKNYA